VKCCEPNSLGAVNGEVINPYLLFVTSRRHDHPPQSAMQGQSPPTTTMLSPERVSPYRSSVSWQFVGGSAEEDGSPAACANSPDGATFYNNDKHLAAASSDRGKTYKSGEPALPTRTDRALRGNPRVIIPSLVAYGHSRYATESPGCEDDSEEGGCGLRHRRAGSGLTSSAGSAMPSPVVTYSPTQAPNARRASPTPQKLQQQQQRCSPVTPASCRARQQRHQRRPSSRYDASCSEDGGGGGDDGCRYSLDQDFLDGRPSWQRQVRNESRKPPFISPRVP
jgi:hypothetical protein